MSSLSASVILREVRALSSSTSDGVDAFLLNGPHLLEQMAIALHGVPPSADFCPSASSCPPCRPCCYRSKSHVCDVSKGQNSNVRVWNKESFVGQEGTNREEKRPNCASNPSSESPETRFLLCQRMGEWAGQEMGSQEEPEIAQPLCSQSVLEFLTPRSESSPEIPVNL